MAGRRLRNRIPGLAQPDHLNARLRRRTRERSLASPDRDRMATARRGGLFLNLGVAHQVHGFSLIVSFKSLLPFEKLKHYFPELIIITEVRYAKRSPPSGATAIVVPHNHPSGAPGPSRADIIVTRALREAAKIIDIELLDHVRYRRRREIRS